MPTQVIRDGLQRTEFTIEEIEQARLDKEIARQQVYGATRRQLPFLQLHSRNPSHMKNPMRFDNQGRYT